MTDVRFIVADARAHREALTELNVEYVSWVFREVERFSGESLETTIGMPAAEYGPTVIEKLCGQSPPNGVFYLMTVAGRLAGMGGLRALNPRLGEVKRLYVRPEFRGMKLGEQMLERLLADAAAFGYERVCLDSGPFMTSAHRLYERYGFTDRPPYDGVEVSPEFHAGWRFMERTL